MASHFKDMGFDINSDNELLQLIQTFYEHGITIDTPVGMYRLLTIDEAIEIWLVMDDDLIDDYEIHYRTDTQTRIRFDNWTSLNDTQAMGLAFIWNCANDDIGDFPTNVCIPDAGRLIDISSGFFEAQIAAFAQEITLYKDATAYKASENNLAPEAFIPMGTFSIQENDDNFIQSATAIMSAVIDSYEKKINSYSGKCYYLLNTHCMGFKLDVLLSEEDVSEAITVGGIISGTFYLSGHIFL